MQQAEVAVQLVEVVTANYISKFTNSTTLGSSTLFDDGNRIGLGTNTPDFSLTVNTTPTLGLGLKVSRTGGGLIGLAIVEEGQPTSLRGWSFESWNQKLRINAAGDNGITTLKNLMTFDRNGNVGIGTENPFYPLHVATNRKYAGYFTTDSLFGLTHAIHGEYLGTGNYDAIGVYGKSVPADYFGYGGYFQGGYTGVYGRVIPVVNMLDTLKLTIRLQSCRLYMQNILVRITMQLLSLGMYYGADTGGHFNGGEVGVVGYVFPSGSGYYIGASGEVYGGTGTNCGLYSSVTVGV